MPDGSGHGGPEFKLIGGMNAPLAGGFATYITSPLAMLRVGDGRVVLSLIRPFSAFGPKLDTAATALVVRRCQKRNATGIDIQDVEGRHWLFWTPATEAGVAALEREGARVEVANGGEEQR